MTPEWLQEWNRCEGWLADALARSGATHTVADVLYEVANNRAQFWPGASSAVVTQTLVYPRRRVLRVWLYGGSTEELPAWLEAAELYAGRMGCDGIEMDGRKGWGRVLEPYGYRESRVVLTKDVQHG